MQLLARVWPESVGFVAECGELRVVSQSDTEDGAMANLREAVEAFLECADPAEVRERLTSDSKAEDKIPKLGELRNSHNKQYQL